MGRSIVIDYEKLVENFEKYITETDYPIIKEFCVEYGYSYFYVEELKNKLPDLAQTIKRCLAKAEVYLEKNALHNKINPIFAMFRLKQPCFAWTDKQELAIDTAPSRLTIDEVKRRIEEKKQLEKGST